MTYPGGKNQPGMYQRIINLMPPHRVYIEPFAGSAAVLRAKKPAAVNIALDLNPSAIEDLAGALSVDGRSVTIGPPRPSPTMQAAGFNNFATAWNALSNARRPSDALTLGIGDALSFLEAYHFVGDELVYCDPPYIIESRRQKSPKGKIYGPRELLDVDHRRLLRRLLELPCPVILSGYHSSMYDSLLKAWNSLEFRVMTHAGKAVEVLWFNFQRPAALHDYRFLGVDRRERERIKRKAARMRAKFQKLPLLERQALFCVLQETWGVKIEESSAALGLAPRLASAADSAAGVLQ